MDRITRTCKLGAALAALALPGMAAAALAKNDRGAAATSPLAAYARARVAGADGALQDAAKGYAAVLAARPDDAEIAARAYRQSLIAGNFALALKSATVLDAAGAIPADGRLLLLARAVKAKDWASAEAAIDATAKDGSFDFLVPVLRAWVAQASGKADPIAILDAPTGSALTGALSAEHRALILLAAGRVDEGATAAQAQVLTTDGGSTGLKLGAAARLQAAGRKEQALAILRGDDPAVLAARQLVTAGKPIRAGALDAAGGIATLLVRVGEAVQSDPRSPLALTLARLANYLDPTNDGATLVLARLLAVAGQGETSLALLAKFQPDSLYIAQAQDLRVAVLTELERKDEALALAKSNSTGSDATLADFVRAGDLLVSLDRHGEAATYYTQAIALAEKSPELADRLWSLWLLKGGAHERAGNWAEAKPALEQAVKLGPLQPAALNYLGYAQLERRENVKAAMALIERASSLRPEDPAITDSLGWAHFLVGDVARAIPALERAVQGQPADPTINEHLGDAYWAAGRRFEARHAWRAAEVFADTAEVARRAKIKADQGFTPDLAAR